MKIFGDDSVYHLLHPYSTGVYIVAVWSATAYIHISTRTTVVPQSLPGYPAGDHIAVSIEEVPLVVDILPAIGGVGSICVAIPPAIIILEPSTCRYRDGCGWTTT